MLRRCAVTVLLILGAGAQLLAQSFLIPVLDRRDHVWDPQRQVLYITTSTGWVERFSMSDRVLLSPWPVGVSLNGVDITPDGSAIYVAEGAQGATQGFLRKVDLPSGAVTNIAYDLDFGEAGAWDVEIANNGKGMLTTQYSGSGWVPLRELVLATDTLEIRSDVIGGVRQNTLISRGADRSLLFFTEANSSAGPIFTYDAGLDAFPFSADTSEFLGSALTSVNREGSLIALEFQGNLSILDPELDLVEIVAADSGVQFSPDADLLYAGDSDTDEILAFKTSNWQRIAVFPVGEDLGLSAPFDEGVMSITDDGDYLFVSTASGIRVILLPGIFSDSFESGDTAAWSVHTP